MFSPKNGETHSGAGSQGGQASTDSTPPPGHPSQSPAVIQQQQPQSYPYGTAHPPYPIPFPFHLVGANPQPHPHHPAHSHQSNAAGIGRGAGNQQPGAGSTLIDPMLSTLSDGEGGISEDEGQGGTGGVKGARNTSVSGHNGISSVNTPHPSQQQQHRHEHEDENFDGDGSQHMHSVGGPDVTQSADGGQPKKKRRRQALSCTECKRRKIKCDRANPCGPCQRRGEADKCQWSTQEPLSDPDPNLSSLSSEKFVTRAEHDLLQAKVMQLETIVATLAPRAYLGGLEHLNLPMGPPPFGFGPPQGPGHPGGPPHHPYPGAPPHGPPGQEGQFQNAAGGSGGPGGGPPTAQDLHQAYQQHFHGYPHPVPQPPQEAQAAPSAQDNQMEVDQQAPQPQTGEPAGDGQQKAEGSTDTANAIDPNFGQSAAAVGQMNELSALLNAAAGGGKSEQAPPSAARPKSRKRKQVEGDVPGEDGQAGTTGSPARGGAAVRGGKAKPRGAKVTSGAGQAAPQWDAATVEAVTMAATGQEEAMPTDNGEGPQDTVTS
ncbi:hypothetical protein FRB96_007466 [Tulasnella sp. 330]|nr:hypothetical protein FRB96_007466 [Tulasnella sp. 330]KAG8887478.1 hypothetical protein FRB98_009559 [Tulasnella sp. 332]